MKNENLTVKQIYRSKNVDLMTEAQTLIFNVTTMGKIAGIIYSDGTVEKMTIEDLRTAQNELIPKYNEALRNREKKA